MLGRVRSWLSDLANAVTLLGIVGSVSFSGALGIVGPVLLQPLLELPVILRFVLGLFIFFGVLSVMLAIIKAALERREAPNVQAASTQTSSSGPNISTGDVGRDSIVHVHNTAPSSEDPSSEDPKPGEEEDDPPVGAPEDPPDRPPPNSPEGASALHPPIRDDELTEPRIENRTINIADFASKVRDWRWSNPVVVGRTFENCRVYGPAVVAPMNTGRAGGHIFVDCRWAEGVDALWTSGPQSHPNFVGVIGLEDCVFRECVFTQVGVLVPPEDYVRYRKRYGNDPTSQQ